MRIATLFSCAALLAAAFSGSAAAIVRCESADGKVTYSNTECPPNTRQVRKVNEAPPIIVHDGKAVATGEPPAPAAQRIEKARPRPTNPTQDDQQLTAQIVAQQRECESRERQLLHLQADFDAAAPANRSSTELALRRAQDEYHALCPKKR